MRIKMNLKIMHTIYNNFGRDGGETARSLDIYIFEVVIIFGTLHLLFRGGNNIGRAGGETARPLDIYFFKVVIFFNNSW